MPGGGGLKAWGKSRQANGARGGVQPKRASSGGAGCGEARGMQRCRRRLCSHPPTSGGDGARVRRATMWQRAAGARREEDGRRAGRAPGSGRTTNVVGRAPRPPRARSRRASPRGRPRGTQLKGRWAGGRWSAVHLIHVRRNGLNRSHNVMLRFVGSRKLWRARTIFEAVEGVPKGPGTGVMQAHDWPWQWHGRQSAMDAACRQALRARRGSQWSPYTQMTAPCRRIVGIPTPSPRLVAALQ